MFKLSNQQEKVVKYVALNGSINSIQAIQELGITRLAARIHELQDTPYQMKAICSETLHNGFVDYVADTEGRVKDLRRYVVRDLLNADTPERIASVLHEGAQAVVNVLQAQVVYDRTTRTVS